MGRPISAHKLAAGFRCVVGFYRVLVGERRIIYTVADEVLLVVVVTVGHRRDV